MLLSNEKELKPVEVKNEGDQKKEGERRDERKKIFDDF